MIALTDRSVSRAPAPSPQALVISGLLRTHWAARLDVAFAGATRLAPADWQRRPWWRRQLSEAAYAAVRVVLGLLGAGRWA